MDKARQNAIALDIKATWERIYSVLITAARRLGNRQECHRLPEMHPNDRPGFIHQQWGPTALQKVAPYLSRIMQLEAEASGRPVASAAAQPTQEEAIPTGELDVPPTPPEAQDAAARRVTAPEAKT